MDIGQSLDEMCNTAGTIILDCIFYTYPRLCTANDNNDDECSVYNLIIKLCIIMIQPGLHQLCVVWGNRSKLIHRMLIHP